MSSPLRYYQILGLPVGAPISAVRQSYRRLSKRYHPDTSPLPPEVSLRRFQELQEAYAILSNPSLKATCDAILSQLDPAQVTAVAVCAEDPPTWRDFSGGELFVLGLLLLAFGLCGLLVFLALWQSS
ncbi:MAG: J domain-containing protein [Thermostichales cyanobacterium SZTDM-1c_bins_54]